MNGKRVPRCTCLHFFFPTWLVRNSSEMTRDCTWFSSWILFFSFAKERSKQATSDLLSRTCKMHLFDKMLLRSITGGTRVQDIPALLSHSSFKTIINLISFPQESFFRQQFSTLCLHFHFEKISHFRCLQKRTMKFFLETMKFFLETMKVLIILLRLLVVLDVLDVKNFVSKICKQNFWRILLIVLLGIIVWNVHLVCVTLREFLTSVNQNKIKVALMLSFIFAECGVNYFLSPLFWGSC